MSKRRKNIYSFLVIVVFWATLMSNCYSLDKDTQYAIKLEEARLAYSMKRWPKLEKAAAELINVRADSAEGQFLLGVAEFYQGKNEQALQRFNWLCKQKPANARYRFFLGRALLVKGLKKDAQVQIEYAVKLKPEHKEYSDFYDKIITAKAAVAGEQNQTNDANENEDKKEPSDQNQPIRVADKRITALLEKLRNKPRQTLELVFTELKTDPEIMSLAGWNNEIISRLGKKEKNYKKELMRRFLLWKSDFIESKEFSFYLMDSRIEDYKKSGDEAVEFIVRQAQKAGIRSYEKQHIEDMVVPWFESLNRQSRTAFLDVRIEDAWNEHINIRDSESSLWNYQTARLALELWQLQGFDNHWLETAQKHLLYCRETKFKIEESNILLANISRYIGEPPQK